MTKWRNVPTTLMVVGGIGAIIGLLIDSTQFGYSWLLAFMFFLSLGLGAYFLVLVHHLFDASWSVPIRRFCEHLACTLPWMVIAFIPIAILAPKLYPWMTVAEPSADHALISKYPLFTKPGFYLISALCFGLWWLFTTRLRYWSLEQDRTGAAICTFKMRKYACFGIVAFAITLTLAAIMWMMGLVHLWFSTMYGVYYFAGSVWMTLATVYVITMVLDRTRILSSVIHELQYYFIGSLLLAFTVFYAYIHFAQYFIIWNANMPEETYWYVMREKGTWWYVGMIIIFGHFFIPFLALLRIDAKLTFKWMVPICAWAWLMHYFDLAFNIMPIPYKNGFHFQTVWLDLCCMALIGGALSKIALKSFLSHPRFPQRDPRMAEAMGQVHPVAGPISGGAPETLHAPPHGGAKASGGAK